MCRRSAEWCTEVWLLQQVPEWPWQQEPGGGGLVVVLRSLRNISVLSIGEGYCYGIVIYDAATCFRRRRGVAVLICFSLSY